MSAGECGAQPVAIEGSLTPTCVRLTVNHAHRDHRAADGYEWPACSQFCMTDHVHGAYRIHMGQNLGPGSVAARAPKKGRPAKVSAKQCSICLAPEAGKWIERKLKDGRVRDQFISSLDRGKCKDREACQARAPQLDIGLEA